MHGRTTETRPDFARIVSAAVVGEVTSALAHDLSQPLNALTMRMETCKLRLRLTPSDPSALLELLGEADKDVERAAAVVQRMRECTRRRAPEASVVDLRDVLARAVDVVRPTSVTPRTTATRPLHVRVDPFQIEQVLVSVLRRAVDAQVRAGLDEIRLQPGPGARKTVVVTVSYPEAAAALETERGTRVAPSRMHDAVARGVLAAHGGTLSIVRSAGRTTVRLTLPAAHASSNGPPCT
jgi:signal transduction histidine kinase